MLLCSPEFRLSIRNAVKSIPGGQASGCIRELIVDVAESLKWIKSEYQLLAESDSAEPRSSSCDMLFFDLKAEILGKKKITRKFIKKIIKKSTSVATESCFFFSTFLFEFSFHSRLKQGNFLKAGCVL
ncbi:hypothetical protein K7X08_014279 [Anisodus acutangulus]|uniref:Uncharacterized protein n=1 Tax=Anisodus acutangulus TaxID=402998 RepID=A0A9Q1LJJ2_9SOLA|nr:hypothetical protein K7X08_014279 [Anisodus acutangulus]